MKPKDIQRLLAESLHQAQEKRPDWAAAFYERLFLVAPQARAMFPDDLSVQSSKLFETVNLAAAHADRLFALDAKLRALGAQHAAFGVEDAQYELVTRCLIETLADVMGDDWSQLYEDAWAFVLYEISVRMMVGGKEGARKRA